MQPYKMTYTVREFKIELTTNPYEYGYFCDPGLDNVENGNYKNKNRNRNYSFNNPNYTIHENETTHPDNEDNTKYNKDTYTDTMIYCVIIVGTVTITTYLINTGLI